NIQSYLASGDALQHSAALQALDTLASDIAALPARFAERLIPSLEQLSQFTATDLLAAGKLAGDPQGLLLQAEREMSAVLAQLQQYAKQSNLPSAAAYQSS